MPGNFFPGLFGVIFFIVYAVFVVCGLVLTVAVVWAVWRMMRAHERLATSVAGIERAMTARAGDTNP